MTNKIKYAGFWRRLSASLVDMLITTPVLISIFYLFGLEKYMMIPLEHDAYSLIENQKTSFNRNIIDTISIIITASYSIIFISSKYKATPGKMLFGVYIVDIDGNKLSGKRATARFFASILSLLLFAVGLIMIAFTKEKTALHDVICKTRVVKKNPNN